MILMSSDRAARGMTAGRTMVLLLVALAIVTPAARADTVITTADVYVNSGTPDGNSGSAPTIQVRYAGGGVQRQSYVYFDLGSVVFTVDSATLRIYQGGPSSPPLTLDVFAVAAAWTESVVTWGNQPGSTGPALGSAPTLAAAGWMEITLDAAAIESMRTGNNYGLMIVPRGDGTSSSLLFNSKEHTGGNPPELIVTGQGGGEHAPVANNDSYTTNEDQTLVAAAPGVLSNDSEPDGEAITAIKVANPAHGTVTVNADGSFTYTPSANYSGADSFTYKANDGTWDSLVATVSLTINPVADPPVAVANSYSTPRNVTLTVNAPGVLGNDTDPDGGTLTAVKVTDPVNGVVTLNSNGSFTYTPDSDFVGDDSFTYKANDGSTDSNTVIVTISVGANTVPVANQDSCSTNQNVTLTVNAPGVLGNDSDADGNPLTAVKLTNPAHGSVTLNSNGSFTYTPTTGYAGPDSFTYKANDGQADSNTATVNVTVIDPAAVNWHMAGANPQRTGYVPEQVSGNLRVAWYRPIEAYIPQFVQIVTDHGRLYVATARGLVVLNASDGSLSWRWDTQMPIAQTPALDGGYIYVASTDRKIHCLDAITGAHLWAYEGGGAAFYTSPLVVGGKVFVGNRDGGMYAVFAQGQPNAGTLAWRFQATAPVFYSAAYKDGAIFFASNDCYAYAVDAATGQQIWRTGPYPTAGFHSWWPVIWGDYVIFTGAFNYGGNRNCALDYHQGLEANDVLPSGGDVGPRGHEPGPWAANTSTMDMTRICQHFEGKPWRRSFFILSRANGAEYTMDLDSDGTPEYAPMDPVSTATGSAYPPIIGNDGVPYVMQLYNRGGTGISRSVISGWKVGTPYMSLCGGDSASDEPMALSAGGGLIYSNLCCARRGQANNYVTNPGATSPYWGYGLLPPMVPGWDVMWTSPEGYGVLEGLHGEYGTLNGVYNDHGDQNPFVPYSGRVYTHRRNCILALASSGSATRLNLVPMNNSVIDSVPHPDADTLKAAIEAEVLKIIAAGDLKPGYICQGQSVVNNPGDNAHGKYYKTPGETFYILSAAYPYLSSATQASLLTYLADQYARRGPTSVTEYGWGPGVHRTNHPIPPDQAARSIMQENNISTTGTLPPDNFYGLWKYAQISGGALAKYNAVRNRIAVPCPVSNDGLIWGVWDLNRYICGYYGYLQLEALAGQPKSQNIENELNRLRAIWVSSVTKDSPFSATSWIPGFARKTRHDNVSRPFIGMTPELGEYLRANCLPKMQAMVAEYNWITPGWFIRRYEGSQSEGAIQHLMDPQMFLAKAWVLKEPANELYKYLDVPYFAVGDLYYIQHVVAVLDAMAASTTPEVVGERIFRNNSLVDGNNPAANESDDNAILAGKLPVLPGQTSSGACVSSYAKGFNGLMVDIKDAANPSAVAAGDFDFQTSPTGAAGSWVAAPAPTSVTVRLGAGQDGSDRVTVIWADNAIQDRWVRVEVKATASTGLTDSDVCYWGNLRGDVTSDCAANIFDLLLVQQNYLVVNPNPAADVTGDGNVNVFDLLLVRQQYLKQLPAFLAP